MKRLLLALLCAVPFPFLRAQTVAPLTRSEIQAELFRPDPAPTEGFSLRQDESARPAAPGKKNVGLAALYSLLLPGMGELYAGGFDSGKYFLIGEGVLWLTYAGFTAYGDAIQADSRAFATARAGIVQEGKSDQYFVDIGNYMSIDEYNEQKLRDRQPEKLYDPAAGYAWQWDTEDSRVSFRTERIRSDDVYNSRKLVVAVILLNHLASAINAARCAVVHNKEIDGALSKLSLETTTLGLPGGPPTGLILTLRHTL
jgi:hypothetical protein